MWPALLLASACLQAKGAPSAPPPASSSLPSAVGGKAGGAPSLQAKGKGASSAPTLAVRTVKAALRVVRQSKGQAMGEKKKAAVRKAAAKDRREGSAGQHGGKRYQREESVIGQSVSCPCDYIWFIILNLNIHDCYVVGRFGPSRGITPDCKLQ